MLKSSRANGELRLIFSIHMVLLQLRSLTFLKFQLATTWPGRVPKSLSTENKFPNMMASRPKCMNEGGYKVKADCKQPS